jgi:hypothetical protein
MTARDLATAATAVTDQHTTAEIRRLGTVVDRVVWGGEPADDHRTGQAWAAAHAVRQGLARRGRWARLRAALDVRALRPPR